MYNPEINGRSDISTITIQESKTPSSHSPQWTSIYSPSEKKTENPIQEIIAQPAYSVDTILILVVIIAGGSSIAVNYLKKRPPKP